MVISTPPRLPPGERLRRAGMGAWAILGILVLGAILLWGLYQIRIIFPPLGLALLIIYALNPIVTKLQQRRVPRAAGAMLTYVVALGAITLIVMALIPLVARQVDQFSQEWPVFRDRIVEFADNTSAGLEDRFGFRFETERLSCLLGADETVTAGGPTVARCDKVTEGIREQLSHHAGRITEIGFSVLEGLLVFILAPLIALYMLIDLPQLRRDILNLIPETSRAEFAEVSGKVGQTLGGFFRGQLLVALIVGVISAIGFKIIGLPFWLVVGALAGFFNLIPLVGPFIGGAVGFMVGTVTQDIRLGLLAAVVELIVQQLDNHVISPNIMRRTVNLHPATVMLSLLAGGALAGIWGVFLGVPTVASAKVLFGHFWTTRVLGKEVSPNSPPARSGDPPSVVPAEPVA